MNPGSLDLPPGARGSYILFVELSSPTKIAVGRLGTMAFDPGVYAYVGSALGPGGLVARLRRYGVGARGKHFSWWVFLIIATLLWLGGSSG